MRWLGDTACGSIGEYDVKWLPADIRQFVTPLSNKMYITHENVTQEHYLKAGRTRATANDKWGLVRNSPMGRT